MAKRKDFQEVQTNGIRGLQFHLEPIWMDNPVGCDSGAPLNESECVEAVHVLQHRFGFRSKTEVKVLPDPDTSVSPSHCSISFKGRSLLLDVTHGPFPLPQEVLSAPKSSDTYHAHLCRKPSDSTQFFQLGEKGTTCISTPPVAPKTNVARNGHFSVIECYMGALEAMRFATDHDIEGAPLYTASRVQMRFLSSEARARRIGLDMWPRGCFAKVKDGVAHVVFNDNVSAPASHPAFSPVCGSGTWAPASPWGPFRTLATVAPRPITSSLVEQNLQSTNSSVYFKQQCCKDYQCTQCANRRRLRAPAYCPWYVDITCCFSSSGADSVCR